MREISARLELQSDILFDNAVDHLGCIRRRVLGRIRLRYCGCF